MTQDVSAIDVSAIAEAMAASEITTVDPITEQPTGHVRLAGGLAPLTDEDVTYDVEVQELNGEHEERIARARRSPSITRFISTLLECGVTRIGGEKATPDLLRKMLTGDREQLLLEIRRATYGDEMEFEGLICPNCGDSLDINFTLDEIPIKRLASSSDRHFEIALRKGAKALVHLPTGEDQEYALADVDLTDAERNTLILQKCVSKITNAKGVELLVIATPGIIKTMSIPDRRTLLTEIDKRQPGPAYNEVKFTHDSCGKEVTIILTIGDLFPYL
jgi:hypothetical protein